MAFFRLLILAAALVSCADPDNDARVDKWGYDPANNSDYVTLLVQQAEADWITPACAEAGPGGSVETFDTLIREAISAQKVGNYAAALEHRLCLHIFAAPFDGARAGSTVTQWHGLADEFPPALAALRILQEKARANTLANDRLSHLAFHDYRGLAIILDERDKPKLLADQVATIDTDFAAYLRSKLEPSEAARIWATDQVKKWEQQQKVEH